MTTHRLDTAKLLSDVDRARRSGAPDEISYRQVAQQIGTSSSVFTRLRRGDTPDADTLCSLIMWLNPQGMLASYIRTGGGRMRRRQLRQISQTAGEMSQS